MTDDDTVYLVVSPPDTLGPSRRRYVIATMTMAAMMQRLLNEQEPK